ncbi:uncharacterized protein LOC127792604 [Diospyros lotus]|uniref:uncharacterized protein LOC127792604 n=1 Tax=Diospyros lotus TaxID=55363 RepID=UPI00224FC5CD|nr:uncharacterized protein LOC127792604 [Diospyros lotus]
MAHGGVTPDPRVQQTNHQPSKEPSFSLPSNTMPIFLFLVSDFFFFFFCNFLVSGSSASASSSSFCLHHFPVLQAGRQFQQMTHKFWEFEEQSSSWVEVQLPFDLVSCVADDCTKVGSIEPLEKKKAKERGFHLSQQRRKRFSLIKISDTSVWVTGASGSIYERFWNGVQWVIAPHDLPASAAPANSVFLVNHTILALSEAGYLYQMQLSENLQPIWVEFAVNQGTSKRVEQNSDIQLKSGVVSNDGVRVYFCTNNGSLLELSGIEPPRWVNHGRPRGADVAAIADAATDRTEVVFVISSIGDLYEYDRSSKPSWKKHIWREGTAEDTSLLPSRGCVLYGLTGPHSVSLFVLTKGGNLAERQLHQRKWKWIVHRSPEDNFFSSITQVLQDELNEKTYSLFLTSASGTVSEYRVPKYSGFAQDDQISENWVNHMHPPHAKVEIGVSGLPLQIGRIIFALDDGRLAELHLSGLGGENIGPTYQVNVRRKASLKYIWSILDSPETEGWNAEYCTEEPGPLNCIRGIKDEPSYKDNAGSMARVRKSTKPQQNYLSPASSGSDSIISPDGYNMPDNWINMNYRLRRMQGGGSFFFVTDSGLSLEYLNVENAWLWLRHEHSVPMRGAVGDYNGSLFFVDEQGSLLIRERSSNKLAWINCTAMRRGRQIIGGPPWHRSHGNAIKVTAEDALFFVSKTGRLLQLTVALKKFKWKDCRNPPNIKVAAIVDQEVFRENIVFVLGRNGLLFQYNKVTEKWHEHSKSPHLVLGRLPGTAMRSPSSSSLTGSLFMLSEDGGLVEYHWNTMDGWNWVEHGTPHKSVTLVGSPGPCFQGNQLFLIGSDGNVYLRYLDKTTWKWKNCGFPQMENNLLEEEREVERKLGEAETCVGEDVADTLEEIKESLNQNCDSKVSPIRPTPFLEDSVIFELRDGRLAEMQRTEKAGWQWSRTIGTPTSLCVAHFWTGLAS